MLLKHMAKIKLYSQARVPTKYGDFDMLAFAQSDGDKMPHVAIVSPEMDISSPVMLRIHSECMTGDVFHSYKCDCGDQLDFSFKMIQEHHGIIIYLRQEGRGIGLIEKLKAYKLQEQGYDTVDANLMLGHQADQRDYGDAISILQQLNITEVDLLTNNPEKLNHLRKEGIQVRNRIPIVLPAHDASKGYFETKKNRMGHLYD